MFNDKWLNKVLKDVNLFRQKAKRKIIYTLLFCVLLISSSITLIVQLSKNKFLDNDSIQPILIIECIFLLFIIGIGLTVIYNIKKKAKNNFKHVILTSFLKEYDNLSFSVDKNISTALINESNLFNYTCKTVVGEDRFAGKRGITQFAFSEIKAFTEKDVFNENKYYQFFNGLFFTIKEQYTCQTKSNI